MIDWISHCLQKNIITFLSSTTEFLFFVNMEAEERNKIIIFMSTIAARLYFRCVLSQFFKDSLSLFIHHPIWFPVTCFWRSSVCALVPFSWLGWHAKIHFFTSYSSHHWTYIMMTWHKMNHAHFLTFFFLLLFFILMIYFTCAFQLITL